MTTPVKIATFVAMLALVFAASLWVGHTFGPAPDGVAPATSEPHPDGSAPATSDHHGGEHR